MGKVPGRYRGDKNNVRLLENNHHAIILGWFPFHRSIFRSALLLPVFIFPRSYQALQKVFPLDIPPTISDQDLVVLGSSSGSTASGNRVIKRFVFVVSPSRFSGQLTVIDDVVVSFFEEALSGLHSGKYWLISKSRFYTNFGAQKS